MTTSGSITYNPARDIIVNRALRLIGAYSSNDSATAAQKGIAGAGKVARDVVFENCRFWKKAGNVANRYIYGANATDVERMFHVKGCTFFNTKLATALPAQCVAFGAEQTEGFVLLDGCTSINNTKQSTTTGVVS